MTQLVHGSWNECAVAAVISGHVVMDLYIESHTRPNLVGGIAQGKVVQVRSGGLQAFVALPDGATGFLQSKQPLKTGQLLPVQVSAYPTGGKAWPLSTELKLSSPCLIYILNGKGVSASSRLADANDLKQTLKEAKLPGGWIIRRQAHGLTPQQLLDQAEALIAQAPDLKTTIQNWLLPPPSVLQRTQLDHPKFNLQELDEQALDAVLDPLLQDITFGQGSRIAISPTPALTAIDVDAGRNTNIDAVNGEAARLIARALRAHNIGGQIVVDFCRSPNRAKLLKDFEDLLADDPLAVTLYGATKLGLVELTRPRMGPSLIEVLDGR